MYAYQMWASAFAYLRLQRGLPLTFEIRKQCALETFKCLSVYAAYLSCIMFFFAIISSSRPEPKRNSSLSNFSLFLLFVIANRGSVDGIVWFMLHDFLREKPTSSGDLESRIIVDKDSSDYNGNDNGNDDDHKKKRQENHDDDGMVDPFNSKVHKPSIFSAPLAGKSLLLLLLSLLLPLSLMSSLQLSFTLPLIHMYYFPKSLGIGAQTHLGEKALKKGILGITKNLTNLADLAIAEYDEADLSPQVNMALRTQVVQYVTAGVRSSIRRLGLKG
jgi:hypothetical protein